MSGLAVVTGAAGGIGEAVVRRLAGRGGTVVAVGRDAGRLDALASTLGPRVRPLALDVADGDAVREALGGLGPVDVLVANAGICETAALDAPDAAEVWARVLRVNLDGFFHCLRAVAPGLRPGGRVVAVSSGLGKRGRAGYGAYATSKHGMLGLVRCAALELAPRGVTVNAVCPGWVDTAMARADLARAAAHKGTTAGAERAAAEAGIPLGRFVRADEVAALIDWLTGPDAAMITGQAYDLSGGEVT